MKDFNLPLKVDYALKNLTLLPILLTHSDNQTVPRYHTWLAGIPMIGHFYSILSNEMLRTGCFQEFFNVLVEINPNLSV